MLRVATIASLAVMAWPARAEARPPDVGTAAPVFTATTLDGGTVDLGAWRGHAVLVNFWATWCAPCRKELPMFETLYRRHRSQGLEVVAISIDEAGSRTDVQALASGLTYPVTMVHDASRNGFAMPDALPLTYVIDAQGVIRARFMPRRSSLTEQDVTAAVLPLLAALPPADAAAPH
jgi:peroxiredoxin